MIRTRCVIVTKMTNVRINKMAEVAKSGAEIKSETILIRSL